MESARPVGLVRGSQRRVDEAVSFADDVAKGLPQSVRGHDRIVAVRWRSTLEARYIEGTSRDSCHRCRFTAGLDTSWELHGEASAVPDHRRARYFEELHGNAAARANPAIYRRPRRTNRPRPRHSRSHPLDRSREPRTESTSRAKSTHLSSPKPTHAKRALPIHNPRPVRPCGSTSLTSMAKELHAPRKNKGVAADSKRQA